MVHAFCGFLEFGEIIGACLKEIRDLFTGQAITDRYLVIATTGFGTNGLGVVTHVPVPVVERQNRPRDGGVGCHEVPHIGGGQVDIPEQIIAEGFHEIGAQPALVTLGDLAEFQFEPFGQLDQQGDGQIAPVMLDQVQITRRYPQFDSKCSLAHPFLAAESPDAPAEFGGVGFGGVRGCDFGTGHGGIPGFVLFLLYSVFSCSAANLQKFTRFLQQYQ